MKRKKAVSSKTRNNWLIDAAVFSGALIALLTGVYFLIFTQGGYQGGRNPWYGVVILFSRHTWGTLHTWGGLLMIGAVAVHLSIHWRWIVMMARRLWQKACGDGCRIARGAWVNLAVDGAVAVSFGVTAVSGLYFFLLPEGGYQGGHNAAWDPGFLWSRGAWNQLHTWGGILLAAAALAHIYIHWKWIVKVTRKVVNAWLPQPAAG